jgi:DNA-binding beta-propeller fold protein YncE
MNERRLTVGMVFVLLLTGSLIATIAPSADCSPPPSGNPTASLLATGLQGGSGSTIGPDGAIYVTEMAAGRVSRVDPETGDKTIFASGLPKSILGFGGPVDVAFLRDTAYVLVTQTMRHYAERLRAEKGLNLQLRIGVNIGEVVVRHIQTRTQLSHRRRSPP